MVRTSSSSYAVLGLLALRDWTAYELVQQTQRSMRLFWPRSEAHVYAELKRLVAAGWADAAEEPAGKRSRTRYAITPEGRDALEDWLGTTPAAPVFEMEAVLRLFFADQGTPEQVVASLAVLRKQVGAWEVLGPALMRPYVEGEGPFPERLHLLLPLVELYRDLFRLLGRWAESTAERVADWEATGPRPPSDADIAEIRRYIAEAHPEYETLSFGN
ncbi:PadR family transcriptional regulator [Nocardioides ultimimeridianus]